MMGDGIGGRVVESYQGVGGGTGGEYYLLVSIFFIFICAFVFWSSCPVSSLSE